MYAVMNVKKIKLSDISKVAKEQGRTIDDYRNGAKYENDIDWNRTNENVVFVPTAGAKSRVNELIKEAGARTRPDSVGAIGVVITATSEFFTPKQDGKGWTYDDKTDAYFRDAKNWIIENLCGGDPSRLVSCVVHMDEKTPHLQALVCPLVENERGETVLSAKRLLNGRQAMRELQNTFHERVGKPRGLDRGELVDLDKPPKKKRKEPQEWREEQLHEAQAKVVEAAKFIQEGTPTVLDNVKTAPLGIGKIIPNDDFEQIVKLLQNVEGLKKALEGLKELVKQADKDGRVKTLEGRLDVGLAKAQEWGQELRLLRPKVKEYEALLEMMDKWPVRQGRTMSELWRQTIRQYTMTDGSVAYDKIAAGFQNNIKTERSRLPSRQQQEINSLDSFEFHSQKR